MKRTLWFVLALVLILPSMVFGSAAESTVLSGEELQQWIGSSREAPVILPEQVPQRDNDGDLVYENLTYTVTDGEVTITGYVEELEELEIPASIEGYPVTVIDSYAFYGADMRAVSLPESMKIIKNNAFYCCYSLERVSFSEGLTEVQKLAFGKCSSLKLLDLPQSLTEIGERVFERCSALQKVLFSDELSVIKKQTFAYCNSLRSIVLPEGLTEIQDSAFEQCYRLAEVINLSDLSLNLESQDHGQVARYALEIHYGETKLREKNGFVFYPVEGGYTLVAYEGEEEAPVFPETDVPLLSIGRYAFVDSPVTSLVIPEGVEDIKDEAFRYTALREITLPQSLKKIWGGAFYGCGRLLSITLPASLESITSHAFSLCYRLMEVVNHSALSPGVGSGNYGDVAYYAIEVHDGESKLVEKDGYVFWPENGGYTLVDYRGSQEVPQLPAMDAPVLAIGYRAFYENDVMIGFSVPEGVVSIGKEAFGGCCSLESIGLPSALESLGDRVFYGCYALKSIVIPQGIAVIPREAFLFCDALESVQLPSALITIEAGAFEGCVELKNLSLPEGLKSIEGEAFYECRSLYSIALPASLESLGDYAFYDCLYLVEVINRSSLELELGNYNQGCVASYALAITTGESKVLEKDGFVFYPVEGGYSLVTYTGSDEVVKLPSLDAPCVAVGADAFVDHTDLKKIYLPDTVAAIGTWAFSGCTALESFTVPEKVTEISNGCFIGCYALETVTIPASVTKIAYRAFDTGYVLGAVYYTGTEEQWQAITVVEGNNGFLMDAPLFYVSRPPYSVGEANGDGEVTFADIQRIYQHLSGGAKLQGDALAAADANKDGDVSFADIQRIYQHLSGGTKLY